jgi:hypothetical protein
VALFTYNLPYSNIGLLNKNNKKNPRKNDDKLTIVVIPMSYQCLIIIFLVKRKLVVQFLMVALPQRVKLALLISLKWVVDLQILGSQLGTSLYDMYGKPKRVKDQGQ